MEFPKDNRHGTIMIYIEHFSKMLLLVLLWDLDAQTIASHLLADVVSYHGLPVTINSNRDPRFQGNIWEELVKLIIVI